MKRTIGGALSTRVTLWLAGGLVIALGIPARCFLFVLGVYATALGLQLARLFNWVLWFWLVNGTVLVWYFVRPGTPEDGVLYALLFSTLLLSWIGFTILLEGRGHERVAGSVSMALVIVQVGLFLPFCFWIQTLCRVPVHPCGCG